MAETLLTAHRLPELYTDLLDNEPKPVALFVPSNAKEQKEAFLAGVVYNPDHTYDRLDTIDFDARLGSIATLGQQILASEEVNPKYRDAYKEFVDVYLAKTTLLELAHTIKTSPAREEVEAAKTEFMRINIEEYGAPDETVYNSLLQEKLAQVFAKNLDDSALLLREELKELAGYDENHEPLKRFKPSGETVQWMHGVVQDLYGGMLSHIPENQKKFDVHDTQAIFTQIIQEELGEAAFGWRVDIEPAKSINVKASEKRVVIPEDRGSLTQSTLRKLIVHELGVHMLRSIIGGQTDLDLLKNGLNEYYDAEEGLGKVMEQALDGKFSETGVNHYITAGLAYFDNKDFRSVFEVKWRLKALEDLKEGMELTQEKRDSAREAAYKEVMRSFRGTDSLPWFKDLSYYNGTMKMWQHLDEIRGDDLLFTFLLLGKTDPAKPAHRRLLFEVKDTTNQSY